jgi:protein-tyrosine-phosphatase
MSDVPEVLFVCVHNAGRSQMAAALLEHHARGRVRVRSAGSAPADDVDPAVVAAMAEVGIDISSERPKRLTEESERRGRSSDPRRDRSSRARARGRARAVGRLSFLR